MTNQFLQRAVLATALAFPAFAQTPFTIGNLVLVRVGDGASALSTNATPVFLDEYTTTGTFVQTLALPTTASGGNRAFTVRGIATSEAYLNVSANGIYLLLAGYDAAAGTAEAVLSGSLAATTNRVIARIDLAGTIDTSTALSDCYSGATGTTGTVSTQGNPRAVVSDDGNRFWLSGTGSSGTAGVRFVANLGATTTVGLNAGAPSNCRVAGLYDGQLYTSSASTVFLGVCKVGSGLPTTSGQSVTLLPGFPTAGGTTAGSTYDYYWADANTVYVADDNAPNSTIGGISKWTSNGSLWTRAYRLTLNLPNNQFAGARGLTGFTQNGVTTLWATANPTNGGGDATQLVTVVDNGPNSVVTSLVTSPTNTAFRGLRFLAKPSTILRTPVLCGTATAKIVGNAELGTDVRTTVENATVLPAVLYGLTPLGFAIDPSCPSCLLGATPDLLVLGTPLVPTFASTLSIPTNPGLVGATIYAQGLDLFAPGGCSNPLMVTATDFFAIPIQ